MKGDVKRNTSLPTARPEAKNASWQPAQFRRDDNVPGTADCWNLSSQRRIVF